MKIGRNDLCPCGSGKKYKKCCITKPETTMQENNYEDEPSDDDLESYEMMIKGMNNVRNFFLKNKPHIKKYKKIRSLYEGILDTMITYFEDGKFQQKIDSNYVKDHGMEINNPAIFDFYFDMETQTGAHAFYDRLVYKNAPNMNCITEEFIKANRYRKPEKIELLQSMLDSDLGLFQIMETDLQEGYVYLEEVFTGKQYKVTDIALSGNIGYDDLYIYMRIITYQDVSFGSGFSIPFDKNDPFIIAHIEKYKNDCSSLANIHSFIELYNYFSNDPKRIRIVKNNV